MQRVTQSYRTDGFGAQFQSLLWTLLWAENNEKIFTYSDVGHIDLISNSGTIKDTEFENTLDEALDYMSIRQNYPRADSGVESIPYTLAYSFVEANIDTVFNSASFHRFKEFFYLSKNSPFDTSYTHVAVHIRKLGNFERENNRFRPGTHDVPNTYYLDMMNRVRSEHSGKKLKFHIYSQGSVSDFAELASDDTIFHLNEKVLDTFTQLIFADILVTCRSSFSYMAALLSNNVVYYTPFWHTPLRQWIRTDVYDLKQILVASGFPFENNKIAIPSHIKRIKLDVGIAIEAIHTEDWLNTHPNDLLVFGFEALPLCVQKTREYFSQPKSKWVRGNHHIDLEWLDKSFLIAPVALGKETKVVDFFVTTSNNVGCSSVLQPNDLLTSRFGISVDHTIKVPMFRLSEFFELLSLDTIEYIEYIKVDVQGTDLEVIQSGGHFITDKVVFVTMEAETDTYHGGHDNTLDNMINYMNSIGFNHIHHPNAGDPTFVNRKFLHVADSIYISQFN
jgi:FkbM family methyltransferase